MLRTRTSKQKYISKKTSVKKKEKNKKVFMQFIVRCI